MKALITGATSGIGRDMAYLLSQKGFDLILASRNTEKMRQLQKKLPTKVTIITADLSRREECLALYQQVKNEKIHVLINNAGFGAFGNFVDIPLETELNMIDLNITALHILSKLFLQDFMARNEGYILNVASSAAFLPGPLMATYYATKAYVLRLTEAMYEEVRRADSRVSISALCPGPVDTGFNQRANVSFSMKGLKSSVVANYALKRMFLGDLVIIPGKQMKLAYYGTRLLTLKSQLKVAYGIQRKKKE